MIDSRWAWLASRALISWLSRGAEFIHLDGSERADRRVMSAGYAEVFVWIRHSESVHTG